MNPSRAVDAAMDTALLAALDDIAVTLTEEAGAIVEGPPERLAAAVAAKRRALRALEQVARNPRVRDTLQRAALPEAVADKLRTCRRLNLAAGNAIARARQDNERVLRFLGHAPAAPDYAENGQARAVTLTRALGSA